MTEVETAQKLHEALLLGEVWTYQFPNVDNAIRILAAAGVIVVRQDAVEPSRLVVMPEYRGPLGDGLTCGHLKHYPLAR
jgi:hypothetical protein